MGMLKFFESKLFIFLNLRSPLSFYQVAKMTASKYKRSLRKQLNQELYATIRVLRKENVFLKKTLAELSRHHAEHNRLVEVVTRSFSI